MNPLSQIDEKSDVPPQAQMMIKQLQQQLQQAQQMLQAAGMEIKTKHGIEQMKQDGETRRELMRVTGKAHDTERWVAEERNQVESVERTKIHDIGMRANTAMTVEEIKGHIALLLARIDERSAEKAETETTERAV
jgi:hypothetical protein